MRRQLASVLAESSSTAPVTLGIERPSASSSSSSSKRQGSAAPPRKGSSFLFGPSSKESLSSLRTKASRLTPHPP